MSILRHRLAPLIVLAASFIPAALCSSTVGAQTPAPAPAAIPASAIDVLVQKKGLTVIKQFNTAAPALTGYVLKAKDGKIGVVYTVQDLIISGKIFDANGTDLAEKYAAENIPKPDYAVAEKSLEADKMLITEGGKNAPVLYVIADPNCIFCHKLWEQTRTWVAQGKVQIRWVMVGFLKPSSAGRAAAIIAAKDRAKANNADHEKFDESAEEGSIAELNPIPNELHDALQKHAVMMTELQFQGTPGLIYKDKDAHWQGSSGMPPLAELAVTLGIAN